MTQAKEPIPDNADADKAPSSPLDTTDERAFGELPFIKQINKGGTAAANGDTESAKAQVETFVQTAVTCAMDPLSFLVGTGVEFVINFVTPVRDAIQLVTGDCDALRNKANEFDGVQQALDKLGDELTQTLNQQLGPWQGEAKEAASHKLSTFVDGVKNTAKQAHNISELLDMSAIMMEAAEGVIKGILKDFLTWAIVTWITATATAGPTFGGSIAAATGVTTAEAAVTCARTAQQIEEITKIIQLISDVIMAIKALLDTIRIIDAVQDITSSKEKGGDANATAASKNLQREKFAFDSPKTALGAAKRQNQAVADAHGVDAEGNRTTPEPAKYGASTLGRSGLTNAATQTGAAADALETQAKKGGFSKVPSDQTISGELDW